MKIYIIATRETLTLEQARARIENASNVGNMPAADVAWRIGGVIVQEFVAPDGMVAVGSPETKYDGVIAWEECETITQAEHESAELAAIEQAEGEAAQRQAEFKAAEAERKATPLIYDQPLQARIETPASDGHVYGLEVDPDGGEIIPVQRESVRKTQAEYEIEKAARMAERQQHRQRLAAIKTDLDAVEAAFDQIDVTAGGVMGVAIAATTGVNKTAMTEIRKALVDIKAAIKNLRQATEKLRKDAK
jgi:hypothetical protein